MIRWLKQHFENYRNLTPWSFCWHITVESFIVVLPFGFILTFFAEAKERTDLTSLYTYSVPYILFNAGIVFPIIETILLQALPVFIARLFKASFAIQLLASWIPFAVLHFFGGFSIGLLAGVFGGFYLGFTYTHWRQSSRWVAFWTTSASHMIKNTVIITIILIIRQIIEI